MANFDDIKNDAQTIKNDVKDNMQNIKDYAQEHASEIKDAAVTKAADMKETAFNWVKENPMASIGIAALIGFLWAKK